MEVVRRRVGVARTEDRQDVERERVQAVGVGHVRHVTGGERRVEASAAVVLAAVLADSPADIGEDLVVSHHLRLEIRPPKDLFKYVTPRGSVTIDGVSLTVARIHKTTFEVALIPTTLQLTQLANHASGWLYNFEADMLVKSMIYFVRR